MSKHKKMNSNRSIFEQSTEENKTPYVESESVKQDEGSHSTKNEIESLRSELMDEIDYCQPVVQRCFRLLLRLIDDDKS